MNDIDRVRRIIGSRLDTASDLCSADLLRDQQPAIRIPDRICEHAGTKALEPTILREHKRCFDTLDRETVVDTREAPGSAAGVGAGGVRRRGGS